MHQESCPALSRPGEREVIRGLYVHVPFCFHKCHYCDFYSIARQAPERMERFVTLVLREARTWMGRSDGVVVQPQTVFFGGGTPSLLPLAQMRRLIRALRGTADLSNVREWTVEVNPATASAEYFSMLLEEGVDRVSMGAQSFQQAELACLERHHEPNDVAQSIEHARAAGFQRLSVDLIYAIPGQDLASWSRSLEAAIALETEHLSCYGLTYEPNTPLAVQRRLGRVRPVAEDLELGMLDHTRRRLSEAGLPPYEISNYARPGGECRHNLLYWNGGNYMGLGPSAASHVAGRRWRNRPHLGEWEYTVERGDLPAIEQEVLSPVHRAGELAMLQLRLSRGVEFADFAARSGFDARNLFGPLLLELARPGLLELDDGGFRLTDTGVRVADAIASRLLSVVLSRG